MIEDARKTAVLPKTPAPTMQIAPDRAYRHEAMLYAGDDGFVEGVAPFVRAGVAAGEPVLVVVPARKIDMLRAAIGDDAAGVQFADMAAVGQNPARIIPAWREFVAGHAGVDRRVRGVGEPLYVERNCDERSECHLHEALLNVALADAPLSLLCPYDTDALPAHDIETAIDNHPFLHLGGRACENDRFGAPVEWFGGDLPEPPAATESIEFDLQHLYLVRKLIDERVATFGFEEERRRECVLAVSEIATNSVRYGGGHGSLRCWMEEERFVCEVTDRGQILEPMVGRVRPLPGQVGGHGMWLANQLADLVQVRSNDQRTIVRVHISGSRLTS
jgi:anti-sigma regulatory factor (Ser/Thr protein kinase)